MMMESLNYTGIRQLFFVNFVKTIPPHLPAMSGMNYFKAFLFELDQTDSKGLLEALSVLNSNVSA